MVNISGRVKKIWASIALLSIELVVVLLLFAISLFGFIYLVIHVFRMKIADYDEEVFAFVQQYTSEANTAFMNFITFFASQQFLIPANLLLIAYFLFVRKHRWYSIKVPVIALGSVAAMSLLKLYFSRPRPLTPLLQQAHGFSFPSGHAMSSMTFYGLLIYLVYKHVDKLLWRWVLIVALAAAILLIGFSRIYLRVHYATDVLAGFSVGIIWLVLAIFVMGRIERFTRRNVAPTVSPNPYL